MRTVGERLAVIPGGYEGGDLVDPDRAKAVIQDLLGSVDVVVVATPPVQAGPGALAWARAVDRSILVARRDHAKREDVAAAAETLTTSAGTSPVRSWPSAPRRWPGCSAAGGPARRGPVGPATAGTKMATPMAVRHGPVVRSTARHPPPPTLEAYRRRRRRSHRPRCRPARRRCRRALGAPADDHPGERSAADPGPGPRAGGRSDPDPIPPTAPAAPTSRSERLGTLHELAEPVAGRSSSTRTDPNDAS